MRILGGRGTVRIRLDDIEAQLLRSMFEDIADAIESDAFEQGDLVRERLFPAGYRDDVAASDDFRELTEASLRAERVERARRCADELNDGGEVRLDAEAGERWIRVVNDVRLALGTRLRITDETDADRVDAAHPQAQEWAVYHWLTALQDGIIGRLGRV